MEQTVKSYNYFFRFPLPSEYTTDEDIYLLRQEHSPAPFFLAALNIFF